MAADQGDKDAQYNLGTLYLDMEDTARNMKTAYMWIAVSVLNDEKEYAKGKVLLGLLLSSQEKKDAQQAAKICFESKYGNCNI